MLAAHPGGVPAPGSSPCRSRRCSAAPSSARSSPTPGRGSWCATEEFAGAVADGRRRPRPSVRASWCCVGDPGRRRPARVRTPARWDDAARASARADADRPARGAPTPTTTAGRCGSTPPAPPGTPKARDAPPRQHPPRLRDLRRAQVLGIRPDDVTLLGGQAVLRLRHRQLAVLPALGRAPPPSSSRGGPTPAVVRRADRARTRPTLFFARADLLRRARRRATCPTTPSPRCGWCASAGEALPAPSAAPVHRPVRRRDPRRHRVHRGAAHLPVQPPRRHPARHHRAGRCPATTCEVRDDDGRRRRTGSPGALFVRGESIAARLLAAHRRDPRRSSRASGCAPATPTSATTTATTSAWAATTTCSRRAASGSRRPRSRAACSSTRPCARPPSSGSPTPTGSTSRWPCVVRRPRVRRHRGGARSPGAARAWPRSSAPRQVVFVDELPKTATGKLQRFKVREPAFAGVHAGRQVSEPAQPVRRARRRPAAPARPEPRPRTGDRHRAVRDRQPLHRRQRPVLRRRVPRRLHLRGRRKLYINPKECIDCGACEPVCPVEAISQDRRVPDGGRAVRRRTTSPSSPSRCPAATSRSVPRAVPRKVGELDIDTPLVRDW